MNHNKWLLVLIATIAAAGCAAPNIPDTFKLSSAANSGVVSGSITYDGGYAGYILNIQSVSDGKNYRIEHGSGTTLNPVLAFSGEDPNPLLASKGSPFAIELPAGEYALTFWRVSCASVNITSKSSTGVRFSVEPGHAIYIGNYHFHQTASFGRTPTAEEVTLSDMSERDLVAIRSTFPALSATPLTQALAPNFRREGFGGDSATHFELPTFVPLHR